MTDSACTLLFSCTGPLGGIRDLLVGNKTAVYISHRLSSCRFCNEIAVFEEGELVQYGSHSELMANPCGQYYALWTAQAQYYTEAVS